VTIEKISNAMYWSVVAKIARFATAMAANILIVRSLGPQDWGVFSFVKTILAFVSTIVMLGASHSILKYLPHVRVKGGARDFGFALRLLILLQVSVWLVLLLAVYFGGSAIETLVQGRFDKLGYYLTFAVGFVIFEIFLSLVTSIVQSVYETKRYAIVNISCNVGYMFMLILFLKYGAGIVGILLAGAIVNIVISVLLLPQVRGMVGGGGEIDAEGPRLITVLRFSLPFVVTGLLNLIVWRHSEVLFLGAFHGEEAAGFFGLAYHVPQLLLEFVPLTIWPIVMAGISEAYTKDSARLPDAIALYYRLLYVLVIPVAAMGFAFSRTLVPLVYGEGMLPAALFTQLFFVVFSYSFLYTPLSMALYVMERSWVNMLVFTILAVVNVGLDLLLIPRYGLWGAFIPVAFVMLLAVGAFYIVARKINGRIFIGPDERAIIERMPIPFKTAILRLL
jgi:O-antigen/teichoic acid export membrane protein